MDAEILESRTIENVTVRIVRDIHRKVVRLWVETVLDGKLVRSSCFGDDGDMARRAMKIEIDWANGVDND